MALIRRWIWRPGITQAHLPEPEAGGTAPFTLCGIPITESDWMRKPPSVGLLITTIEDPCLTCARLSLARVDDDEYEAVARVVFEDVDAIPSSRNRLIEFEDE